MRRQRQHQHGRPSVRGPRPEGGPTPLSPEGGGAAAAGVMDAVQLRKERRWARSFARSIHDCLFSSGVRRTNTETRKGEREREVRFVDRFYVLHENHGTFLTDHAIDAYLEMFMGELSLRADDFFFE